MSYPNSPLLLKGALIYYGTPMLIPVPNIIIFQYNPESLSRNFKTWKPAERAPVFEGEGPARSVVRNRAEPTAKQNVALSQPFDPTETFTVTLELDATDALEQPENHPVAMAVGVADRLAAIEMLLYPPGDSLLGGLLGSVSGSVSSSAGGLSAGASAGKDLEQLNREDLPIVLFFWGPGRIVPVCITSLAIEEQQYSPFLYPTRAKASIGLQVLLPENLPKYDRDPATGAAVAIAKACYQFTRGQKEALAIAKLPVESIVGMLPS